MTAERREAMMKAVESPQAFGRLRDLVKQFVDEGVPPDQLLDDLSQIRALVSEETEESVLDVMDLLVGWCAPEFRIIPRKTE
jgi:hypothetical protein